MWLEHPQERAKCVISSCVVLAYAALLLHLFDYNLTQVRRIVLPLSHWLSIVLKPSITPISPLILPVYFTGIPTTRYKNITRLYFQPYRHPLPLQVAYWYGAPALVYGWWLVAVTYLQHHNPQTLVYSDKVR